MKYDFSLKVGGIRYPVIAHDIRLSSNAAGVATFDVEASEPLSGSVYFAFSLNGGAQHGHFFGYVERSVPGTAKSQRIFCREKANAMEMRVPMSLRKTTLREVLEKAKEVTGCGFALPTAAAYTSKQVPHFINTGTGFHMLRTLASVFDITGFTWQQRRDGLIYVGSWADGHWKGSPIDVPSNLLDKSLATQSAELLAIPGLRPGYVLNGKRLCSVQLKGNKMVVSWKKP